MNDETQTFRNIQNYSGIRATQPLKNHILVLLVKYLTIVYEYNK